MLKDILAPGGQLFIEAGITNNNMLIGEVETEVGPGLYPIYCTVSFKNQAEGVKMMAQKQKAYLDTLFGAENVLFVENSVYPPRPSQADFEQCPHFIVTNN